MTNQKKIRTLRVFINDIKEKDTSFDMLVAYYKPGTKDIVSMWAKAWKLQYGTQEKTYESRIIEELQLKLLHKQNMFEVYLTGELKEFNSSENMTIYNIAVYAREGRFVLEPSPNVMEKAARENKRKQQPLPEDMFNQITGQEQVKRDMFPMEDEIDEVRQPWDVDLNG